MARTKADFRQKCAKETKKGSKATKASSSKDPAASSSVAGASDGSDDPVLRLRPGMRSLREIREYQTTTELLLRKVPFQKLVREIAMKIGPCRFEVQALLALQEAAEMFLVGLCEDASICAGHGRRVTLMARDLQLSRRLRCGTAGSGQKAYKSAAAGVSSSPSKGAKDEKIAAKDEKIEANEEGLSPPSETVAASTAVPNELPMISAVQDGLGSVQDSKMPAAIDKEDEDDEDDEDYESGGEASGDELFGSDPEGDDVDDIPILEEL